MQKVFSMVFQCGGLHCDGECDPVDCDQLFEFGQVACDQWGWTVALHSVGLRLAVISRTGISWMWESANAIGQHAAAGAAQQHPTHNHICSARPQLKAAGYAAACVCVE